MGTIVCSKCGSKYSDQFKCKQCGSVLSIAGQGAIAPSSFRSDSSLAAGMGLETGGRIRFGLAVKLMALMLVVSLVPVAVLWGINFRNSSSRIEKDNELLIAQTAAGLGKKVDEWIDKHVRILKFAASVPEIQSMDRVQQEPMLKAIQATYPWMYLVHTMDLTGMNVARDDGHPLANYVDRLYYKEIVEGKTLAWQTVIGRTSKKPALIMSGPIMRNNKLVGVLAICMNIDDISNEVAGWKKGKTGFAFLVDESNKVVAHPNPAYVAEHKDVSKHPLVASFRKSGKPLTLLFQEPNPGAESLGHVVGLSNGWALAIQQQDKEVFAALENDKRFALILLAVTILVVVALSLFASRAVVTPIKALTNVAERMSLGELDVRINVRSRDEIGQLARAVGRMQNSLRLAMSRFKKRS
jgi:methyl-accepting chemotaxis protein